MTDTSPKSPVRVLIVDDNQASAQMLGWAVEMLGAEYRLSHEGRNAIDTAGSFAPHVVLLDIGLPGMDGYEVCRTLRADPRLQRTIFAAQTGWSDEKHRLQAQEAGFHHHLVKPVDLDKLKVLVESVDAAYAN